MWQCWKFEYLINLDLFYLWDLEVWYVCDVSMLGVNGLVNNLGMSRPGNILMLSSVLTFAFILKCFLFYFEA